MNEDMTYIYHDCYHNEVFVVRAFSDDAARKKLPRRNRFLVHLVVGTDDAVTKLRLADPDIEYTHLKKAR